MARSRDTTEIYSPRLWGVWLLVGIAWLVAKLPLGALRRLGAGLGIAGYYLAPARRHISNVNLSLCFPHLDERQRRSLNRQVFKHVGIGGLELTAAWLNPKRAILPHVRIEGAEHLTRARSLGRGVLLVGFHSTAIDIFSGPMASTFDADVMYRRNKNPVWEWLQLRGRKHYFKGVIERDDIRETFKRLKAGRIVWYAPDQDYGPKHSVFAPFFGIPAATITATARLARFNRSPVVFMTHFRDSHRTGWTMTFHPMLEDFPTDDDVADARRINALVEDAVRKHPEQYLWLHRRFKTRPPGEGPVY